MMQLKPIEISNFILELYWNIFWQANGSSATQYFNITNLLFIIIIIIIVASHNLARFP